jgi:hypothetical protein
VLLPPKTPQASPSNLSAPEIWDKLNADQQERAAFAFWSDPELSAEHETANQALAKSLHTRPKTVKGMPIDRKSRLMLLHGKQTGRVLMAMLVAFHLRFRRTMLTDFLDLLEIEHRDGYILDMDKVEKPTRERLTGALGVIGAKFPSLDLWIYFACLIYQDQDFWSDLRALTQDLNGKFRARSD